MKYVLQIPAHLYTGGVEKVARDIGLYADRSRYQVDYLVFDQEKGNYEEELIANGCRVFHIAEPSDNYLNFWNELKRIMTETKYDVVHAHTMFNIGLIMLAARRMRVPVRVSHAHSALINNGSYKVKAYEAVMRYSIQKNANTYISCGDKAGIRLYGEAFYHKHGQLILNGIDTRNYRYDEKNRRLIRNQLKLNENYIIGHVGHLLEVKNQQFLIRMMPEILKKKSDARLLLLGDGPDRSMLENLISELELQDYVIMTGNVSNVNQYLSAMDVFAFPSLYEGMPLSILEVQANGLPCILSERIPRDVFLTDLLTQVSLEHRELWIQELLKAKRVEPESYQEKLYHSGIDTCNAMQKIYEVYEKQL